MNALQRGMMGAPGVWLAFSRRTFSLIILLISAFPSPAVLASEAEKPNPQSACRSRLDEVFDREIQQSLPELESKGGAKRSGIIDWIIPSTRAELEKMNAMAIYAVQVFAKEEKDLPIQGVLYSTVGSDGKAPQGAPVERLPEVFPLSRVKLLSGDGAEQLRRLVGERTQIVYGFIPVSHLMRDSAIGVRFAGGLESLELAVITPEYRKRLLVPKYFKKLNAQSKLLRPDPKRLPDAPTTLKLLADNYCVGR